MERCVQTHVFDFLKSNRLLTVSQSGFIPKDSTTFQLLTIYEDLCNALDKQTTSQAVFFDISKAFDRVWHAGLIRKLYAIGIRDKLLDWFKSYLSGRTQAVVLKGKTSNYLTPHSGVPQGSVLGPLLFLIYINDIDIDIQSIIKLFADDTSTYLCVDNAETRCLLLNSDMMKITQWAKRWKVDFNASKTELLTISNKTEPETRPLVFDGMTLVESQNHKHLGVILQNNCKWDCHITSLIAKVRTQVACLKSHKYKLSRKALETMYKAFILPHFDYSDIVWDNCTGTLADELEKLNLDAIRTITGAVRGTSHDKLYKESGILPLRERRRRHKLIAFFKIILGITPEYLSKYLPRLVSETNPYHRRNPLERYIQPTRLDIYKKSFFPSVTVEWNKLPDNVKSLDSVALFKRHLALNDVTVPPYYFSHDRFSEIIHCKIRLEISDLNGDLFKRHLTNDKSCACGKHLEDARHFFLECPIYRNVRISTISAIPNLTEISLTCLTHGDSELSLSENRLIFDHVQDFIRQSKRF